MPRRVPKFKSVDGPPPGAAHRNFLADMDLHRVRMRELTMTNAEQRRAARIEVDLPACTRAGDMSLEGRACNLSQDGMLFLARGAHTKLEEIEVEIQLPDADEPLALSAEVRWVRERGMGLRFHKVAHQARLLLANYVLRRASQF